MDRHGFYDMKCLDLLRESLVRSFYHRLTPSLLDLYPPRGMAGRPGTPEPLRRRSKGQHDYEAPYSDSNTLLRLGDLHLQGANRSNAIISTNTIAMVRAALVES
jgi:hypothetical protein